MITPTGLQQAFILIRPLFSTPEGFGTLQRSIASMRSFSTLDAPRAWINRELQGIHLNDLGNKHSPEFLSQRLAEIQGMLISRISVLPAGFESYFHLAGTSLFLAQNLAKSSQHNPTPGRAAALHNVQSAFQYAQDIAPADPRTGQIENLGLELKKL